ncbi:MAG: hypothetical protein KBA14_08210 [Saprospiraceae bacterium]|nr:hypothetical protein [Saprospiraceae bacterium]
MGEKLGAGMSNGRWCFSFVDSMYILFQLTIATMQMPVTQVQQPCQKSFPGWVAIGVRKRKEDPYNKRSSIEGLWV